MNTPTLFNITSEKMRELLPRECLEKLFAQEIEKRTVYLLGDRIFSTKEKALSNSHQEEYAGFYPLRVILSERPGMQSLCHCTSTGITD